MWSGQFWMSIECVDICVANILTWVRNSVNVTFLHSNCRGIIPPWECEVVSSKCQLMHNILGHEILWMWLSCTVTAQVREQYNQNKMAIIVVMILPQTRLLMARNVSIRQSIYAPATANLLTDIKQASIWLPRKVTLQFGITDIHEATKYIMVSCKTLFRIHGSEPFWFNEIQTGFSTYLWQQTSNVSS